VSKPKKPPVKTWQPTVEDAKLLQELRDKLGVTDPAILRLGIRQLHETTFKTTVDK